MNLLKEMFFKLAFVTANVSVLPLESVQFSIFNNGKPLSRDYTECQRFQRQERYLFAPLLFTANHALPYPKSLFLLRLQIIVECLQGLAEASEEQVLLDQLIHVLNVRHLLPPNPW